MTRVYTVTIAVADDPTDPSGDYADAGVVTKALRQLAYEVDQVGLPSRTFGQQTRMPAGERCLVFFGPAINLPSDLLEVDR